MGHTKLPGGWSTAWSNFGKAHPLSLDPKTGQSLSVSPTEKSKGERLALASCDGKTMGRKCWGSQLHSHQGWGSMTKFSLWLRGAHWAIKAQVKGGSLTGGNSGGKCVGGALLPQERKSPHWDARHTEGTTWKYHEHQLSAPLSYLSSFPFTQTQEEPPEAGGKGGRWNQERDRLHVSEPAVGKEKGFERGERLHFDLNHI